jgi:hypothetical protein
MSRNQADILIVIGGLILEAIEVFGLTALGASERLVILGGVVCLILTCLAAGDDGIYDMRGKGERKS